MTPRQRVRKALNHEEPDRVPLDFGGTHLTSAEPEMQARIAEHMGLTGSPDPRFRNFDDRIQKRLDCDLRLVQPNRPPQYGFTHVWESPLRNATLEDVQRYPHWPKFEPDMISGLADEARFLHEETDYAICAAQVSEGIFETGCYLRGYDQILLDMVLEPERAHAFFRKVLDVNLELSEPYLKVVGPYVDMVLFGDDLAMQDRPYMSPATFDSMIRPYFKTYVDCIRAYCPKAFIAHHCCGSAEQLFGRLLACGVQIHEPVQTTARNMEPEKLKHAKPGLGFLGGLDLQHVLPFGTREEVVSHVRRLMANLAPGGGWICAPCHTLPADVRPENIVLALETARQCGEYPIRL